MRISNDRFLCNCVSRAAAPLLLEILEMFTLDYMDEPNRYLNLESFRAVEKKHGNPTVVLILNLLENCEMVNHGGSLESSSFLTNDGTLMRDYLRKDNNDRSK